MAAQRAFFFRADAQDGVARSLIERVGLEFETKAVPDFEGVAQHKIFRLGINCGAVPGWRNPSGADFDAAIGAVEVHEARAADYFCGASFNGCEDYRIATLLFGESFFDNALKVFKGVESVREPLEDIVDIVPGDIPENFGVAAAQRVEANYGTFQRDGRDNVQWRQIRIHGVLFSDCFLILL